MLSALLEAAYDAPKKFAAEDVLDAVAKLVRVTSLDSCPHGAYFMQRSQ